MAEEEIEQTLLIIKQCFVYKIPPRSTAAGHKAADWGLSSPIWNGRLIILAKGDTCIIRLESDNGTHPHVSKCSELFAMCPINGPTIQYVEPVTDSSRYFVVRIEDGRGHHAFIGLGFNERSDAFDFNACLQDHEKHIKLRKEAQNAAAKLGNQPKIDYSLKEGQTIHVNIKIRSSMIGSSTSPFNLPPHRIQTKHGAVGGSQPRAQDTSQTSATLTLLPPPPGSRRPAPAATATAAASAYTPPASTTGVVWGEFQSAPQQPQLQQPQQQQMYFQPQQQLQQQQVPQQQPMQVPWGGFQGTPQQPAQAYVPPQAGQQWFPSFH